MNRLKPILSLVIVSWIALDGQCQKKIRWFPGYVVTWESDTLVGYIDVKRGMLTSEKLHFKKSLSSKTCQFTAMKLRSFYILNQSQYITENIQSIDVRMDEKEGIILDTLPPRLAFLQILATGCCINLYALDDNLFFIKQPMTNIFEQLIFGDFKKIESFTYNMGASTASASIENNTISHSSRTITTEYYGFRQTLATLIDKNNPLLVAVWATEYNAVGLMQIINSINRSATTVNASILAVKQ